MNGPVQVTPLIPFNTLANPPLETNSFTDVFKDISAAWQEFQKTGKLSYAAFQQGMALAQGGAFNYLTLFKAGIGLGTSLIPGGEFVAPLLNFLLGWLWPNKRSSTTKDLMDTINKEITRQIQEAMIETHQVTWAGYLNACRDQMETLATAIVGAQFTGTEDDAVRTPQVPTPGNFDNIAQIFRGADGVLDLTQNQSLNQIDYLTVPSAPYFAMGVTMRLGAYQSWIRFLEKWIDIVYPVDSKSDNNNTWHQTLDQLKLDMRHIIWRATNDFMIQFNGYYGKNSNTTDQGKMPPVSKDSPTKAQINKQNVYIRTMILNVLDVVATWPTMFPDDYSDQMTIEQTRVLVADMVGQNQASDGTVTIYDIFDNNNQIKYDAPSYFHGDLQQVEFSVGRGHKQHDSDTLGFYNYPYKVRITYTDQQQFDSFVPSGFSDVSGSVMVSDMPILKIDAQTQYSMYVDGEGLTIWSAGKEDRPAQIGPILPGSCYSDYGVPGPCPPGESCKPSPGGSYRTSCNIVLEDQKLNALYAFRQTNNPRNTDKIGLIATYVSQDLNVNNVFGEQDTDTKEIVGKGIPAEKATLLNGNRPSTVKEWVNGANAVPLTSDGLQFKLTNLTAGQYRFRVRFANPGNDAQVMFSMTATGNPTLRGPVLFPSTSDENVQELHRVFVIGASDNVNYVLQDMTLNFLQVPSGDVTVTLSPQGAASDPAILIDRLEIVPKPVPVDPVVDQIEKKDFQDDDANFTIWKNLDVSGGIQAQLTIRPYDYVKNTFVLSFLLRGVEQSRETLQFGEYIYDIVRRGFDEIQIINSDPTSSLHGSIEGTIYRLPQPKIQKPNPVVDTISYQHIQDTDAQFSIWKNSKVTAWQAEVMILPDQYYENNTFQLAFLLNGVTQSTQTLQFGAHLYDFVKEGFNEIQILNSVTTNILKANINGTLYQIPQPPLPETSDVIGLIPEQHIDVENQSLSIWKNPTTTPAVEANLTIVPAKYYTNNTFKVDFLLNGSVQSTQNVRFGETLYDPIPQTFDEIQIVTTDISNPLEARIVGTVYRIPQPPLPQQTEVAATISNQHFDMDSASYSVWKDSNISAIQAKLTISPDNYVADNTFTVAFLLKGVTQSTQALQFGEYLYDPILQTFDEIQIQNSDTANGLHGSVEGTIYKLSQEQNPSGTEYADTILEHDFEDTDAQFTIWKNSNISAIQAKVTITPDHYMADNTFRLSFLLNGVSQSTQPLVFGEYVYDSVSNEFNEIQILNSDTTNILKGTVEGTLYRLPQPSEIAATIPKHDFQDTDARFSLWKDPSISAVQAKLTIMPKEYMAKNTFTLAFLLNGATLSTQPLQFGTFPYSSVSPGFNEIQILNSDTTNILDGDVEGTLYRVAQPNVPGSPDIVDSIPPHYVQIDETVYRIWRNPTVPTVQVKLKIIPSEPIPNAPFRLDFYLKGEKQDDQPLQFGEYLYNPVAAGFDEIQIVTTDSTYKLSGTLEGTIYDVPQKPIPFPSPVIDTISQQTIPTNSDAVTIWKNQKQNGVAVQASFNFMPQNWINNTFRLDYLFQGASIYSQQVEYGNYMYNAILTGFDEIQLVTSDTTNMLYGTMSGMIYQIPQALFPPEDPVIDSFPVKYIVDNLQAYSIWKNSSVSAVQAKLTVRPISATENTFTVAFLLKGVQQFSQPLQFTEYLYAVVSQGFDEIQILSSDTTNILSANVEGELYRIPQPPLSQSNPVLDTFNKGIDEAVYQELLWQNPRPNIPAVQAKLTITSDGPGNVPGDVLHFVSDGSLVSIQPMQYGEYLYDPMPQGSSFDQIFIISGYGDFLNLDVKATIYAQDRPVLETIPEQHQLYNPNASITLWKATQADELAVQASLTFTALLPVVGQNIVFLSNGVTQSTQPLHYGEYLYDPVPQGFDEIQLYDVAPINLMEGTVYTLERPVLDVIPEHIINDIVPVYTIWKDSNILAAQATLTIEHESEPHSDLSMLTIAFLLKGVVQSSQPLQLGTKLYALVPQKFDEIQIVNADNPNFNQYAYGLNAYVGGSIYDVAQ
ncbi:delta endotoxin C-terminal domain-containing protein [Thermoactinomyces sp. DSM 45892]|uniref:delta endotoxin C-terminal domain-containing protein n=1 Tax=Thermoactinomyces sp. DSM 45892 TaxID=1882753 RepID=UPI00089BA04E|nr:delta endotoxin C-terminal domain-containing protein [Thermoactinomyces sp. DSM 45892]SDY04220.1 delta endotoxin [Thermoactinomyces sp. DSM 45892]